MPKKPRFYYFLSNNDQPLDSSHPLWRSYLPQKQCFFDEKRLGTAKETPITYGEYFHAARKFIRHNRYERIVDSLSRALGRNIDVDEMGDFSIYLEKHGEFYHPARITFAVDGQRISFVLNVAVSEAGKVCLEREYRNLDNLGKKYSFGFLPIVFCRGDVPVDDKRCLSMFIGEWFEGFHEFHLSERGNADTTGIQIWDPDRSDLFLSRQQAVKVYEQAAMILTAYYNVETFEQIFAWHHAAGDFVVDPDEEEPVLKLVAVRRYEPLFQMEDDSLEAMINTLLIFFLNMSMKLRLDRLNGVAEIAWIDDFAVEAIVNGFFKGLKLQAANALIPEAFIYTFKMFLRRLPKEDIHDLFGMIVDRMNSENIDLPVIRTHLEDHISATIFALNKR